MASLDKAPRCLIVEDEALISMMIEEEVETCGYGVIGPFSSCEAALALLEKERPELALIDFLLSDGPCLELARALQALHVPFAILSGYDPRGRLNQHELHDVVWVRKPITPEQLEAVLRDLDPRRPSCRTPTASSFIAPN